MSQTTQQTGQQKSQTQKSKDLLCKTFVDSQFSQVIDPQWVLTQLLASGLQYQPQSPMAFQARFILNEDIKLFIANYYKANNVDIESDESVAKQINTWFESALVKTNPWFAQQSGAISQERLQELMGMGGFGYSPFGFGAQMPGQMGMGGMNPMMGGGMGMNPMMGGGMGFGAQMPSWKKKDDQKGQQQQQQQQGFNPMMMGMGMPGCMPSMGMGGMNPMMGMGFGQQQGFNPYGGGI